MLELTPEQLLANQHLERLDDMSRKMEAKWGVDRLPKCIPSELLVKWDRQWAKLNHALDEARYVEVAELAQGCVRGWEALERAAEASGYKPDLASCLEYQSPSGTLIRVCASRLDAAKPNPPGIESYSLEQVVNIIESQRLVNKIASDAKKRIGEGKEIVVPPKEFWDAGGDPLPF